MNYTIIFVPEIEDDLANIYKWYEDKSKGLGEDFLRIFYTKSVEISRNPLIYQKIFLDFRRALIRRFPYSIYYLIKQNYVVVYGVFHTSRDPKKIKNSVSKR